MLREEHQYSLVNVAVTFGSSNHNQRIKRFWSYLRHAFLDQYTDLFKGYIESGVLNTSNALHNECLAFYFMGVIRKELTQVKETWDCHRVRQMKHQGCPSGVPNVIYDFPDMYGFQDQRLVSANQLYFSARRSIPQVLIFLMLTLTGFPCIELGCEYWLDRIIMNSNSLPSVSMRRTALYRVVNSCIKLWRAKLACFQFYGQFQLAYVCK